MFKEFKKDTNPWINPKITDKAEWNRKSVYNMKEFNKEIEIVKQTGNKKLKKLNKKLCGKIHQ